MHPSDGSRHAPRDGDVALSCYAASSSDCERVAAGVYLYFTNSSVLETVDLHIYMVIGYDSGRVSSPENRVYLNVF